MRRFMNIFIIMCILIPAVAVAQKAEVNKKGTTAAKFLRLDIGARSYALGGAYVPIAEDATAMVYNPAGLASMTKAALSYHNVDLYADIRHQFIGLVIPTAMERTTIGFYINSVNYGTIFRTSIEDQSAANQQYIFSSSQSYGMSIARQVTDRVFLGISSKFIIEKIWLDTANGFAFDVGAVYEPGVGGLRLGVSIRNLGPDMRMDRGPETTFTKIPETTLPGIRSIPARLITDKFNLPIVFNVGFSFDLVGPASILLTNDVHKLSIISEMNDAFDAPLRSIIGAEYTWKDMLSLRGGTRQNYDLFEYSFGAGLKIPVRNSEILFDYAYADFGDLEGVYVASLEIRF